MWVERVTRNSRLSKMLQQGVCEFFLQRLKMVTSKQWGIHTNSTKLLFLCLREFLKPLLHVLQAFNAWFIHSTDWKWQRLILWKRRAYYHGTSRPRVVWEVARPKLIGSFRLLRRSPYISIEFCILPCSHVVINRGRNYCTFIWSLQPWFTCPGV